MLQYKFKWQTDEVLMGHLIKAEFGTKLTPKLLKYDSSNDSQEYQADIFTELFPNFPQFKAHVAAYVERHYCTVINDEDHPTPAHVLKFLDEKEVHMLNEWILSRGPGFIPSSDKP